MFDRNKIGQLDFREFCCALSIICLGSTNEKLRFFFDLFDLDRDGFLSRKEQTTLMITVAKIMIDILPIDSNENSKEKETPSKNSSSKDSADLSAVKANAKLRQAWIDH